MMKLYMTYKKANWIKTGDDGLQIRWHQKGYPIDIFRPNTFDEDCENILDCHEFGWPNKVKRYKATFIKTVRDAIAILDYSDDCVKEINEEEKNELDIGIVKITFTNTERSSVTDVCWINEEGKEHINAARTSWDLLPYLGKKFILPQESDVSHETTTRKERQLQINFRDILLRAYENTCCISHCNVSEALEAAHIVPVSDPNSFDPRNGLLLRADLHRLFDKNMFGIDHQSRKVRLSKVLANNPQYRLFNGKRIREPQPPNYRPNANALAKRWKQFKHNI